MDGSKSTELLGPMNKEEFAAPCRFFFADSHLVIMRKTGTGHRQKQARKVALPRPFSPLE